VNSTGITEKDRRRAQRCVECLVCKRARPNQRGFSYWFVKTVDERICPFCKAYEKVYGRKAHEPAPNEPPKRS
jgi:uncharacterized protein CbrC (UPF0167 family)